LFTKDVKSGLVNSKIDISAEYKTVKVRKQVAPPKEKRIAIPEEYQTITKTKQVIDDRME